MRAAIATAAQPNSTVPAKPSQARRRSSGARLRRWSAPVPAQAAAATKLQRRARSLSDGSPRDSRARRAQRKASGTASVAAIASGATVSAAMCVTARPFGPS